MLSSGVASHRLSAPRGPGELLALQAIGDCHLRNVQDRRCIAREQQDIRTASSCWRTCRGCCDDDEARIDRGPMGALTAVAPPAKL